MASDKSSDKINWKSTICGICPAGCWVRAGMKDGQLVKIEAEKGHPLGMICRRGEHAPEIVYSKHRLQYPMKRTGEKGKSQFARISWDEAYEIIVNNLNKIKDESGPEAVAIYTGRGAFELSLCDMFQPKGVAVSSASNVLFPFGSPNTMGVGALCYVSFAMIAPHVTMGRMLINMFTDMENSELLIVWGANPATDSPPLDMLRLEAAARRGAEIVVIDPRRSETVDRTAARWIPIRPGTDGALALSMIEVMLDEELYDESFAEKWCHGFEELKQYVQHFQPESVQDVSGVPADTIRYLARRITRANGACPVMYTGLEYSDSGIQAIRAVLTLFALGGQLDVPGGIGLAMLNSHFPVNCSSNQENPDLDRALAFNKFPIYSKYRGESHASGLVASTLTGKPYRIRGLLIHGASLLTSWPQTPLWRRTLQSMDFQVCIDRQMTADAAYADVILPATTMFEINSYMTYGPIFRLREKLIEPVGEARNDYLIMAELARRLGYGHLYPQTEEEMIRKVLEGSGYSLEKVRKAGGWIQIDNPVMEYRKWEKGGLRPDGEPGFDTPTGKFEIWSTVLEDYGYEPLPKYTEPSEGPLSRPDLIKDYPLVFNSGARPQTDFRSQHHGIEGLAKDNPEPTVEINAQDAEQRKIHSGDLVEVRTLRGAIPFRARVTDTIVKGAIECNMGGGTPVGPKAWQEWNVNELTDLENYDEISGFPVYKALLCDVHKIEAGRRTSRTAVGHKKSAESNPLFNLQLSSRSPRQNIYLDNNATTAVAPQVKEAMLPFLEGNYGNPSTIHHTGVAAREGIEQARRQIARLINCRPNRIIMTGCGSESDNQALKGMAFSSPRRGKHIITGKIEHPAILNTCRFLESMGFGITYLDVDEYGLVNPADLKIALTDQTILVSLMLANNEVGTIQPIKELCKIAHEREVYFHTDAVQAAGKIKIDVEDLDVDMLTLSGHKFHAPKGVGILYLRRGIELEPLIHGGKQEKGLRAGTENVPGIVGMGKAAELAVEMVNREKEIARKRNMLEAGIKKLVNDAVVNGHPRHRLPNTLNMTFPGIRGESIVIAMDQHGISLSAGSACKSGSPEPTHVLLAMGKSAEEAHCSVRFSLSDKTTTQEIKNTLRALKTVLEEMKSTIRFLPCK
jgi:cysteine desulfurase NifS